MAALILASLGIVFGDIGTSPLYSLQTVFSVEHHAITPTPAHVLGIISLVLWTVLLIVTMKYVTFVLRADHHGEGGILALATLGRNALRRHGRFAAIALPIGLAGACLFMGDSVITPAISVLSAVEGLGVLNPAFDSAIVPLSIAVLVALFLVQRFGTGRIGISFGPIMALWFVVLALLGIPHIFRAPEILLAISPTYAASFLAENPYQSFLTLGAVVLVVTGAEALYADLGHFGRAPITKAWLYAVFPALALNYLGQGAMLLRTPENAANPFYLMAPTWAVAPLTVLATVATIIASQAVISGTFSVTKQAVRLGYLPSFTVRNTSAQSAGQIYIPVINWFLLIAVVVVVAAFRSSASLANAYGMAVSTTFLATTALLLIYLRYSRDWSLARTAALGIVLAAIEVPIFVAASAKFLHGGWLPVLIGAILGSVMAVWNWGRGVVTRKRNKAEGTLREFYDEVHKSAPARIPGTAIFPHAAQNTAPLALRSNLRLNKVLHEHTIIVRVHVLQTPHVPIERRAEIQKAAAPVPGLLQVDLRYGFFDRINIPVSLTGAFRRCDLPGIDDINVSAATYVLSSMKYGKAPGRLWKRVRAELFVLLTRLSGSPVDRFHLPERQTVQIGQRIDI